MGTRPIALIGGLVLSIAACAGTPEAALLKPGSTIPAVWRDSTSAGGGPTLFWVFRTNDCLTCQNLDYQVRRVQRRFGGRLHFVAVHVGSPRDESIPRAYLRERRVRAELRTVSSAEMRRVLPDGAIPAIYLADGALIRWHTRLADDPEKVALRLDHALNELAAPARAKAADSANLAP
ncbi:MAG TPA: hypothetical protein VF665_06130 [Longimicrobium sp.]|jgi:hypothetical protein|uniref:hypothetical protein n=1 Tax=Longimicrobium sp. TaxID=2029185 RepID=UPI002ED89C4C